MHLIKIILSIVYCMSVYSTQVAPPGGDKGGGDISGSIKVDGGGGTKGGGDIADIEDSEGKTNSGGDFNFSSGSIGEQRTDDVTGEVRFNDNLAIYTFSVTGMNINCNYIFYDFANRFQQSELMRFCNEIRGFNLGYLGTDINESMKILLDKYNLTFEEKSQISNLVRGQ